jgi:hypothetical protein
LTSDKYIQDSIDLIDIVKSEMKITAETQRTQSYAEKEGGGSIKTCYLSVPSALSAPPR